MERIERQYIDWVKTGTNLRLLRNDNLNLRRYVCSMLNSHKEKCDGVCESCIYDLDKSISRKELADVMGVSDSVIVNWESGKTAIGIEDLIMYSKIAGINLFDIIVFEE